MHQNKIPISLIVLKEGKITNRLIRRILRELGSEEHLYLDDRQWVAKNMPHVSRQIQEWRAKSILAGQNKEPMIFKQIEDIKFPYLTVASLYGNHINSIEGLCRLAMPALQALYLRDNCITRIDSLRKANVARLSELSIYDNPLTDCDCLIELETDYEFKALFLNNSQCSAWIFKLQAKKVRTLYLWQNHRSRQPSETFAWVVQARLKLMRKKFLGIYRN